jgi:hypothetical protein
MQTIDKLHAVNSSSNDESVQVTAVDYDNSYAKVAARRLPAVTSQRIESPKENTLINQELPIDADDGFKGVERKRNRIKRFFLTGIAECVEEKHIRAYLERRNIKPTHISIFKGGDKSLLRMCPAFVYVLIHYTCYNMKYRHFTTIFYETWRLK